METRGKDRGEAGTVVTRNEDIPVLASVLSVMQLVCKTEEIRRWQRERMVNITSHLTGMPGGRNSTKGFEDAFAALSETDEAHQRLCAEYAGKLKAAQAIIDGIASDAMRAFVVMKYVMFVPDVEIRRELSMTRRRFDAARECIENARNMKSAKWSERYALRNVKKL